MYIIGIDLAIETHKAYMVLGYSVPEFSSWIYDIKLDKPTTEKEKEMSSRETDLTYRYEGKCNNCGILLQRTCSTKFLKFEVRCGSNEDGCGHSYTPLPPVENWLENTGKIYSPVEKSPENAMPEKFVQSGHQTLEEACANLQKVYPDYYSQADLDYFRYQKAHSGSRRQQNDPNLYFRTSSDDQGLPEGKLMAQYAERNDDFEDRLKAMLPNPADYGTPCELFGFSIGDVISWGQFQDAGLITHVDTVQIIGSSGGNGLRKVTHTLRCSPMLCGNAKRLQEHQFSWKTGEVSSSVRHTQCEE